MCGVEGIGRELVRVGFLVLLCLLLFPPSLVVGKN